MGDAASEKIVEEPVFSKEFNYPFSAIKACIWIVALGLCIVMYIYLFFLILNIGFLLGFVAPFLIITVAVFLFYFMFMPFRKGKFALYSNRLSYTSWDPLRLMTQSIEMTFEKRVAFSHSGSYRSLTTDIKGKPVYLSLSGLSWDEFNQLLELLRKNPNVALVKT
jgi:hypothetical protein